MSVRNAEHRAAVERRLDSLDEALRNMGERLDGMRSSVAAFERELHNAHVQARKARAANAGEDEQ